MWDFPALRFCADTDQPVRCELGDLQAGIEVAASSLWRGREKAGRVPSRAYSCIPSTSYPNC
jgi:hypothetical protein